MPRRHWLALALTVHAVIHVLAFQAAWGIGSREEFSGVPAFPVLPAGSLAVRWLGTLWLVAGAGFVVAATLVIGERRHRRGATALAALVSLAACVLWWHDAPVGATVDLVLLTGVAVTGSRGARVAQRPARLVLGAAQAAGWRGYGTIRAS